MKIQFRTYDGRHPFVLGAIGKRAVALLDVGNLGDGESTTTLLQREVEARGGTYYGLDSNEPLTKKLNLPNQKVGDLHHAPFDDASFDVVYAGEILEHTWEPNKMIRECYRILKPGGQLILDTPNAYSITNIVRFLLKREDSMGDIRVLTYHEARNAFADLKEKGELLLQPQHKIFYTPAMLKQLLETQGFVIESMGVTHKPHNLAHKLLLRMFPHSGRHLCVVARRATVDEAFADVKDKPLTYF